MTPRQIRAIHDEAHVAGMTRGEDCVPVAMIVGTPSTFLGSDVDPTKPTYYVADGVCGFAWVKFPGNTSFGRGMKALGLARKAYLGGLDVNVPYFNQSMTRKEAYARAYANVLRNHGIDAYAESRMD